MQSLRKSLLLFVFSGSSMRRWNDKLRPVELYEVDKQGHKMITAFLLYQLHCRNLPLQERIDLGLRVIEGGLFDYLYRLVITDIKPPVFYRIRANAEHYAELTRWVLGELEPVVRPLNEGFWSRLVAYHTRSPHEAGGAADRILRAAHLYSSQWEYNLIKPLNFFDEERDSIAQSFVDGLRELADVKGVRELLSPLHNPLAHTANLCGQLRFQIRWSQTPRVPETSVLGHLLVVAAYAYFLSLTLGVCEARRLNNFFCGLFHDLPELLTRDIITPVKRSVQQLPSILHQYEREELENRVLAPLQEAGYGDIRDRLAYFLGLEAGSEFMETIQEHGKIRVVAPYEVFHRDCNQNHLDPKDGRLIKICDTLAAFIETHSSIYNGISSPALFEARARIRGEYRRATLGDFSVGTLLADFD